MVVVLPAPLGPRKPKTSPRAHLEADPGQRVGRRLRVPLDQVGDLDGQRSRRPWAGPPAAWSTGLLRSEPVIILRHSFALLASTVTVPRV